MNRCGLLRLLGLLLILALLIPANLAAQEEEVANEEEETIILRSHYMRYNREEGFYLAQEEVEIYYQDYILTGDEAEIHEDAEVLYMTGNVVVYQGDDVLKGEYLTFYYEEEHMIMDSPFDLVQYRDVEQEDGTIEREPLHMVGGYLEMFGDEDRIYAREDVHLIYREYNIWAHELDFFEEDEELHLVGDVVIEENGEYVKAQEAKMWLADDTFEAWRDVEAEVQIGRRRDGEAVEEVEETEEENGAGN